MTLKLPLTTKNKKNFKLQIINDKILFMISIWADDKKTNSTGMFPLVKIWKRKK